MDFDTRRRAEEELDRKQGRLTRLDRQFEEDDEQEFDTAHRERRGQTGEFDIDDVWEVRDWHESGPLMGRMLTHAPSVVTGGRLELGGIRLPVARVDGNRATQEGDQAAA